jgi:hypothetical protein
VDLCMISYVLPNSLKLLHDNVREFTLALLRPPSLRPSTLQVVD